MYTPHVITLINVSENADETLSYNATVLDSVFLDTAKATNSGKAGLTDADTATLFIPFTTVGKSLTGRAKSYFPPMAYEKLTDKSIAWTLKDGGETSAVECFFVKGNISEPGSYDDMKREYDYVYAVTRVLLRDFGSPAMQHFQVGAR